jgi:FkbM family methyltransferase
MKVRTFISNVLRRTPLSYFPVAVRKGPAKGARWTFLPFSYNWREGGEDDIQKGLEMAGDLKGRVCWDFGAHFGIHTVGMALQVGSSGQVAAFEPDSMAFRRLADHVKINRLTNVDLFHAAVSNKADYAKLIVSHGLGSTLSHFQYEDEVTDGRTKTIQVETVVPDELVARGKLRPPNLIKVDVQGHGAKALGGSIRSIEKMRPIIIFSSHSPWELNETHELLLPLGYSVLSLSGEPRHWDSFRHNDTTLLFCKQV